MTQNGGLALVAARPGRIRTSLQALLAAMPQINVIDQADDGASALRMVAERQPALVLLDTNLPGGGPFDSHCRPQAQVISERVADREERQRSGHGGVWAVLRQVKTRWPQVRCLVLVDNGRQRQTARAIGADGVLIRGFPGGELFATIEQLLSRGERCERP